MSHHEKEFAFVSRPERQNIVPPYWSRVMPRDRVTRGFFAGRSVGVMELKTSLESPPKTQAGRRVTRRFSRVITPRLRLGIRPPRAPHSSSERARQSRVEPSIGSCCGTVNVAASGRPATPLPYGTRPRTRMRTRAWPVHAPVWMWLVSRSGQLGKRAITALRAAACGHRQAIRGHFPRLPGRPAVDRRVKPAFRPGKPPRRPRADPILITAPRAASRRWASKRAA